MTTFIVSWNEYRRATVEAESAEEARIWWSDSHLDTMQTIIESNPNSPVQCIELDTYSYTGMRVMDEKFNEIETHGGYRNG